MQPCAKSAFRTYFSNQLYDLRGHIELVRQRLALRPMAAPRMAAE